MTSALACRDAGGQASWYAAATVPAIAARNAALSAQAAGANPVEQAALLREIFGPLPFRPVTVEPSLLSWCEEAIPKLAQATYEARSFEGMTELAELLQEAGCNEPDILSHCRQQEKCHWPGCWVLDLLLAKP